MSFKSRHGRCEVCNGTFKEPVTHESKIRIHLIIEQSYQRILIKFYGELGCGLETNWLHFGDDPLHYSDPGVRSGSRSGPGRTATLDFDEISWTGSPSRAWPRDQVIKFG